MQKSLIATPICLAALLTVSGSFCLQAAPASDWRIVPGKGIGHIALGMRREQVHALLSTPTQTHRTAGVIQEQWTSNRHKDVLTVYYRQGHVIQIEATSPAFATSTGLSARQSIAALAKKQTWKYASYGYHPRQPYRGWNKHYVVYADDAKAGLAWRAGVWTSLAADLDTKSKPDAVIVHYPGKPVLPQPNGSKGAADYLIGNIVDAE